MELTVMNKRRYDELVGKITNLELEIAKAHTQLEAIHNSNNQLAEIAFDEAKFTDFVMEKVDDLAREAARDTIDIDDIASEVANNLDVSEDVQRAVDRMGYITSDDVNDKIEDYINDNDILNSSEVESAIEDYVSGQDYIERADVESMIEDALDWFKDDIIKEVIQAITNKLTAKENDNANNSRDHSLHISGTDTTSQGASMLNAPAQS